MIRKPIVSGRFYSSDKSQLKEQIESFVDKEIRKEKAKGMILPHAGYMYSGKVATQTVSAVDLNDIDTFIIFGPNHTGEGKRLSIVDEGSWETPLGKVEIDSAFAKTILENSELLEVDPRSHASEHSIEVQLPILQHIKKAFKFVPITVFSENLDIYRKIADSVVKSMNSLEKQNSTLIIASSDMTHYEPQKETEDKDSKAIKAILELDEEKLLNTVEKLSISMCGYAPAAIVISACNKLGAKNAKLVKYQTSGDTTGDFSEVVGYAGITIS